MDPLSPQKRDDPFLLPNIQWHHMFLSAPSFHFDRSNFSNPSTSIYFEQLGGSFEMKEYAYIYIYILYTPKN